MTIGGVTRERWRLLEPLLDAALDLAPAERAAFVERACGSDASLRNELLALLAASDGGEALFHTPAAVAYAPLLGSAPSAAYETTPSLELPPLLGDRYGVVREIGRGGMATVYLADDRKHRRQVAVKVLHAAVARAIGRERFVREIEIAATLSHPHILPLHDSGAVPSGYGDEPAFLYYVTPYVAGESLRDRLRRPPPLAPETVRRLGQEVASGLAYAHRQGVVHLDVKPGNILLQEGHAVIADFGIARAVSETADAAATAAHVTAEEAVALLGTPAYMSPEQARMEHDLDGRSDVYSLGCVLYEMLTGGPPFPERTLSAAVMAAQARARAPTLPDPAPLYARAPRALASAVMRAMAPAREDRFATASELAHALAAAEVPNTATEPTVALAARRTRRRRVAAAAGVALAAAAGAVALARRAPALDDGLIAVAPFDVAAPSLALWHEGLVDVLSRDLDGAGPLRAVPPTQVIRRWSGRADVPSAQALGRATGARLVLFGGLLAAGDSVRASVVLLDARTGERRLELERRDVPSRVDRLADSVAVAVLRELGRERGTPLARAASAPTESMSALKAYLQGEQFYRAARWDSAQAHFERAIAEDSTFALAYHRLATILRWRDAGQLPDSTPYLLMLRASRFTTWLAPRERVLAAADSGAAETYFAWRRTLAEPRTHVDLDGYVARLRAQLERDLRAYPDDAELWFLLAETRARYDRHVEVGDADDRATLALFDRAIALDSSFAPAYLGALPVVAYLDGAPGARRYIRTYLEREPGGAGPRDDRIRLADALLDPERAEAIDFRRLVDTLPPDALCEAAGLLQHAADSTDVVVRLARALVARASTRAANAPAVPACAVEPAIAGLLFRGHLRDADRLSALERHQSHAVVRMDLARFGVLPTLIARAELRDVLTRLPYVTDPRLYVWWAADGDTAAIATYARLFDSVSARAPKETFAPSWRASAASGHAFLALARRDTAEALRRFASTRDTTGACRYTARGTHAQLLLAKHRDDDAADLLARLWPGASNCHDGVDDVLWTLARARASDRLGRRVEAMVNYTLVADAWRTADPELQSYVREARAALVRLRRGPA